MESISSPTGMEKKEVQIQVPSQLPQTYEENYLVLMARDPYWAFAYWEVSGETRREIAARLGEKFNFSKVLLKVHDISGKAGIEEANWTMDIAVEKAAGNWYLHVGHPNHTYVAQLGYLTPDGEFISVMISNRVTTPRDDVSEVVDSQWMLVEEELRKIYGPLSELRSASGSEFLPHIPLEIQRLLRERMKGELASPGLWGAPQRSGGM